MADVTVKALKYHTLHGEAHDAGDSYDVAEAEVDNLVGQGMVARVASDKPAKAKPSQPVVSMTTEDFKKGKK